MSNAPAEVHFFETTGVAVKSPELSKRAVVSANTELERHELWLKRHHELYSESLKECQRQLERRNIIDACVQAILLPINLLVASCSALFQGARGLTRRFQLRAELQSRINAMDQLSLRRLPRAPWHTAEKSARPKSSPSAIREGRMRKAEQ
jgi:hypothetical protein